MKHSIETLSPAELIVIGSYKKIRNSVRYLIKYSIFDLIIKDIIVIKCKELKNGYDNEKYAYFIKLNIDIKKLTRNLLVFEKMILSVLPEDYRYMSYQEFVTKMSYFDNSKFRRFSKEYRFEKQVVSELLEKKIFQLVPFSVLRINLWSKIKLTQKGIEIERQLGCRDKKEDDFIWVMEKYNLFHSNSTFFNSDLFFGINSQYDQYFQQALDRMGIAVAGPVFWLKKYPELQPTKE